MRKFTNVVMLTHVEAYHIVKDAIRESLHDKLSFYLDGRENIDCFKYIHNLKENFQSIEEHMRHICALEIFNETGAELIIITSNKENAVISRAPYEEELSRIKALDEEIATAS